MNFYSNPVIWADVPDPDVIRVGDVYYMTSTTMHFCPGCPIMKSYDLVTWEIIGYVYDILEDDDTMNLENGKDAYGKGSWASSLRYHDGVFYVAFAAYNTDKTYIYQTRDIEKGVWERYVLEGVYHDMSLLFDNDGRVFMVYGGGDIRIIELDRNATAIKTGGMNKVLLTKDETSIGGQSGLPAEGAHIYKIDGRYYIFLISWPSGRRRLQLCLRADKIDGRYEGRIVCDKSLRGRDDGIAQGGIVQATDGAWYAVLFQDNGAVGRAPAVIKVNWEDGWPVFEEAEGELPIPESECKKTQSNIILSDDFNNNKIGLHWQWNHNPDETAYSLTERTGLLRIKNNRLSADITRARNILTQRTFAPECAGIIKLDASGLKDGDTAGFAAFQYNYGYVGVKIVGNEKYIVMINRGGEEAVEAERIPLRQDIVYFKIYFDFKNGTDKAYFYFSLDGEDFTPIGNTLQMSYSLKHFTGYRFALFIFAERELGGYADFDYFKIL